MSSMQPWGGSGRNSRLGGGAFPNLSSSSLGHHSQGAQGEARPARGPEMAPRLKRRLSCLLQEGCLKTCAFRHVREEAGGRDAKACAAAPGSPCQAVPETPAGATVTFPSLHPGSGGTSSRPIKCASHPPALLFQGLRALGGDRPQTGMETGITCPEKRDGLKEAAK